MRKFLLKILIFQNPRQLHVYLFPSFHYFLLLFFGSFFFSHLFCFGLFQLLCCSYNLFLTCCLTPFSRLLEECTPAFQANPWLQCFPQSTAPDDICPGYNQVLQPLPSFSLESCSPVGSSPQEHQGSPLVNTGKPRDLATARAHFKPLTEEKKYISNLKWNLTMFYFVSQAWRIVVSFFFFFPKQIGWMEYCVSLGIPQAVRVLYNTWNLLAI